MVTQLVREHAKATLERLQKVGWCPYGARNSDGNECVLIAMDQSGTYRHRDEFSDLYIEIMSRIKTRGTKYRSVAFWNDAPSTHWEDVRDLLLSIINDKES